MTRTHVTMKFIKALREQGKIESVDEVLINELVELAAVIDSMDPTVKNYVLLVVRFQYIEDLIRERISGGSNQDFDLFGIAALGDSAQS